MSLYLSAQHSEMTKIHSGLMSTHRVKVYVTALSRHTLMTSNTGQLCSFSLRNTTSIPTITKAPDLQSQYFPASHVTIKLSVIPYFLKNLPVQDFLPKFQRYMKLMTWITRYRNSTMTVLYDMENTWNSSLSLFSIFSSIHISQIQYYYYYCCIPNQF